MSDVRRNYWRHAMAVNRTTDPGQRSDFRDPQERHEWLASRRTWQHRWPWQDGKGTGQ